jgi:hypothetical protein
MPGYGLLAADKGTGLLPWSWARERLERSHDYWLATSDLEGSPHVMPVWGVWLDDELWFSSSRQSRKARHLAINPRCAATTDNPQEPVVIEGNGETVDEREAILRFVDAVNRKYQTEYGLDFFTQASNGCWRIVPTWAFGLLESDFTGSPTRWIFNR